MEIHGVEKEEAKRIRAPGGAPANGAGSRSMWGRWIPLVWPVEAMSRTLTYAVDGVPSGIRYMAIGAFWFSVMSVFVKLAGRTVPSMEIVMYRGLVTLVLSYWVLRRERVHPIFGVQRRLLLMRGVFGSLALSCFIFSLTHLPLGEATLIQYTNPVFAIVLAALWYHERIGKRELWVLAASFVGVLLITRPVLLFGGNAAGIDPVWALIALGGAVFSGTAYAIIRRLGAENSRVVVFYLPLLQIPMSLPFMNGWRMPSAWEWALLIGAGIATQLAQTYMTRGLQTERTARATTTGYLQIVFAAVWAVLIFRERFSLWTVLGAVVIVGAASLLVLGRQEAVPIDE
jgi:drug/metabolite transporter (DMT)-like permease